MENWGDLVWWIMCFSIMAGCVCIIIWARDGTRMHYGKKGKLRKAVWCSEWCSAYKPWVLAFMWMLLWHMPMVLSDGSSQVHCRNCSGMVWGQRQNVQGVALNSKFPQSLYDHLLNVLGKSGQDMTDLLLTFWYQILEDIFRGLEESMHQWIRAILVAHEGPTQH